MDPIQLITVTGAAGVALWVLKQVVDGKLHTSSETDGLRQDKADLLKITQSQGDALKAQNEQGVEIVRLLREVLEELSDRETTDVDPA